MMGFRDILGRFAKADGAIKFRSRKIAEEAGQLAVKALKKNAPVGVHYIISSDGKSVKETRPATLKKSLKYKLVQTNKGTEVHILCAPHAAFVVKPTKAHEIVAKNKKSLRFFWPGAPAQVVKAQGGNIVHFTRVWHPGTKGNPFHERTIVEIEPKLKNLMNKGAARVLTEFF